MSPSASSRRAPHPGDGLGQRFNCYAHSCRHALPAPLWSALVLVTPPADPEEALFRDVVARAVLDALGHVTPISGKNQATLAPRVIAEARAWFELERDTWREAVFALANYDEGLICALVRAEVRRIEREGGVVAVPPAERAPKREPKPDMPGAEPFAAVRGPRRPFAVERIKRRVNLRDREQLTVIQSYLNRSNAHAESAPR